MYPSQTPSKWEFGVQGDLYIARNPRRRIQPARLPDELSELVAHPAASVRLAAVGDLDQLAGGANLGLAAGARMALKGLVDDDSRRVCTAAISALERTALRITPNEVEWEILTGSSPQVQARIEGGPLAEASSIEVTHEDLHARIAGSILTVTTTSDELVPPTGQVRLTGPAGEATVNVTGTVGARPHQATPAARARRTQPEIAAEPDQPSPVPLVKTPAGPRDPSGRLESATSTHAALASAQAAPELREPTPEPAQPRLLLVTLLLLVAAAATVENIRLPAQLPGMQHPVLGQDAKWWFILPGIASVITIAALPIRRFRTAAIGIIVGAAIAMWLLWARTTARDWGIPRVQVTLHTGLWTRLLAAAAFSCAAAMLIAASPQLRARVRWRRDVAAILGACLVIAGAVSYLVYVVGHDVGQPSAYAKTQTVIVLLVFLPVTMARLNLDQRRAALVAATAFVIFVEAREAWLAVTNKITDPDSNLTTHDLRIGYAVAVAGLLIVLAGCFVSQGLRSAHETARSPEYT